MYTIPPKLKFVAFYFPCVFVKLFKTLSMTQAFHDHHVWFYKQILHFAKIFSRFLNVYYILLLTREVWTFEPKKLYEWLSINCWIRLASNGYYFQLNILPEITQQKIILYVKFDKNAQTFAFQNANTKQIKFWTKSSKINNW